MRWRDRIIGIVLGVVLGIGIVTAFVFLYSEQTVDAPSLSDRRNAGPARGGYAQRGSEGGPRGRAQKPPPVRTVQVIGGAPPETGPAELHYRKDGLVRLRVDSDLTIDLELLGYGISRTVDAGQPELIRFRATKAGNFPLIVTASHIDVARITVGRPRVP